ncbi:MAG: hypothetical protein K2G72_05415 [Duncaniella sp.]|nr:hypothetical protein [Duncaniella sp.]
MIHTQSMPDFVATGLKYSRKSDKKGRPVWDLPVTKAYYRKLGEKVITVYKNAGYTSKALVHQMMEYLTNYMRSGYIPTLKCHSEPIVILFQSLRLDVDAAIERSARARQRAAERKAQKEAERQATETVSDEKATTDTATTDRKPESHQATIPTINPADSNGVTLRLPLTPSHQTVNHTLSIDYIASD